MVGPQHAPVLTERIVELLSPALTTSGSVLVDCTLGMGGHSAAILQACPEVRVIGIDRDREALSFARQRLAGFSDRFTAVHANYADLAEVLAECGQPRVSAILFDLGVSSWQLDAPSRGFAYRTSAPLDMRMDQSEGLSAAEVLNSYPQAELVRIMRRYGEERFAPQLARAIVQRRESAPFVNTTELVELIYATIPAPARRTGGHPAKRTFQALRIEVNQELVGVQQALPAALTAVSVGGRVVVEAYHSLEDRIVKRCFAAAVTTSAPPDLPVVPAEFAPKFRLLTRGAERASTAEIEINPRAASVRLRAVERVSEGELAA